MNQLELTLKQAIEMRFCPNCKKQLLMDQPKRTLIISFSNLELDCITHFQCPFCKTEFRRDKKELKTVFLKGF